MSSTPDALPRRPGRPALFDRGRALGELLTLFWRKGYDGATQEEMLAATGLSSSTLYRSFGNKPEILERVLRQYTAVADQMFTPLSTGRRGVADIHAFFDAVGEWLRGPMGTAGCLVVETMQDPINQDPRIKALTDRHLASMGRGLQSAIDRAVDSGELPPSASENFAGALQAAVLGVLSRARARDVADALRLLDCVRSLLPTRGESTAVSR